MSPAAAPIDPTCCPLCGQPNRCAMERQRASGEPQPPCWCTEVDFSSTLLDQVPPTARRQACVCRACAEPAGAGEIP
ncbi:MAG: cysteine-rich CWC family protein [Burkholderiales bacterium]|nr:cysteine-rich CWC family protein [Burkholderiales bacterium]MBK8667240.1 cysteine-rich CWC family protein [Burkholderiales bacterium]